MRKEWRSQVLRNRGGTARSRCSILEGVRCGKNGDQSLFNNGGTARDKIEEATKKRGLKRRERSICLGRKENDRGGGYGGYKWEGIGKAIEKRGLKRQE
ncbi:hypothetical protein DVH24_040633 [Malus domestica]|uniref:Uncharacterized protein n=1 Tax=Malus domestica TaxID=3750 RepID=A0A498I7R6_MALDO|nr:hypothetical protein DVH24_040633 [Malus domestica]